ncbi:MbeB family mobilization protein [Klebsiella quasipneumoniae subsp. similipneumoniae]|uniref:MbeB family mobilization protein n=1 Tax=Enterobacteriaceae TaxID=543 RepID=UPI0007CC35B3|nr:MULTISPECIES: MbeB family mobilization protein [Enterobacteriaceae]MBN9706643.1 MbeB family mobilization protein [Enterobacter roggenkampii]MCS0627710.1 MbeB family mobilization protein [Enterobacter asburiae]SAV16823.1 MbeB-like%2C N-term conserved region [Klebsiella pneumoniae]HDR2366216.1 MbeB family mobilization protein [Enterobacter asburiae]
MSEILNLAKGFEEKSRQQAQDTEQSVKREFERLETSISEDLKSSSQNISNAIREQNDKLTRIVRYSLLSALGWIFLFAALLIMILGGIIWFQGTVITSRLNEMDSYSQQLESLKAQSGAGVVIYKDDNQKNTYLVVLPKKAHGTETYTSKGGNTVMKYTAK